MRLLRDFRRNESGAVAMLFAISIPALVGGVMVAVDAAALVAMQNNLQSVADSAALAGAKELHVHRPDDEALPESVSERALALMAEEGFAAAAPTADVAVDEERASVAVTVSVSPRMLVLNRFGYADRVSATAEAHAFGSVRLCVLALDEGNGGAIEGARVASIKAAECAVQSNSAAPDGIRLEPLSRIDARATCSSGGVEAADAAISPEPETDCPAVEDPLADRALPAIGPCDYDDKAILLPGIIRPGHYCGGLTLAPTALVTAEPGDYVISGGPLKLAASSSLVGENVSFRFADAASTFSFGVGSIVRLSAPKEGPLAGFLFYQEPGIEKGREFLVATDLATKLLGTIYLPSGTLKIDVVGLVAAASAYTVVVAHRIDVKGADLVINSDYDGSDVPVPTGVGPTSGGVALSQ